MRRLILSLFFIFSIFSLTLSSALAAGVPVNPVPVSPRIPNVAIPQITLPNVAAAKGRAIGIPFQPNTTDKNTSTVHFSTCCTKSSAGAGQSTTKYQGTVYASSENPSTSIVYHGGPTEQYGITLYDIYWGNFPSGYVNGVQNFQAQLQQQNNTFQNDFRVALPQYGSVYIGRTLTWLHADFNGVAAFTDSNPIVNGCSDPWFSQCVTDTQLQNEVVNFANAHGYPQTNGYVYVIHLAPGVGIDASFGSFLHTFCAYHTSVNNLSFIVQPDMAQTSSVPNPNGSYNTCDTGQRPQTGNHTQGSIGDYEATANAFSHEISETISDPTGQGYWFPDGQEIGDVCPIGLTYGSSGSEYTIKASGYPYFTQSEYSQIDTGCINGYPS